MLGHGVEDGSGQRVLAARLQGGCDIEDLLAGLAGSGDDLNHSGLVTGQCAGLVESDGADPTQRLQGCASLDQGADAAGRANGSDHGDWH